MEEEPMKKSLYRIDSSNFIGLYCELADLIMRVEHKDEYKKLIKEDMISRSISYTSQGQDIFDEWSQEIEHILATFNIVHENCPDPDQNPVNEDLPTNLHRLLKQQLNGGRTNE